MTLIKAPAKSSFFTAILLSITAGYSCEDTHKNSTIHLNLEKKNTISDLEEVLNEITATYDELTLVVVKEETEYDYGTYMFKLAAPLKLSHQNNSFILPWLTFTQSYQYEQYIGYADSYVTRVSNSKVEKKNDMLPFYENFKKIFGLIYPQNPNSHNIISFPRNSSDTGKSNLFFKKEGIEDSKLVQIKNLFNGLKHDLNLIEAPSTHPFLTPDSDTKNFKQIPTLLVPPPRTDVDLGEVIEFQVGSLLDFMKNKSQPVGVYKLILAGKLI